jgi:enamine deaminase RidA (YjgF/YER057c/UK114 family)
LGKIDDRLAGLGLELPEPPSAPPGIVLPFKWVRVSGGYAYASGHGPLDGSEVLVSGKVGADVSPERGYEAARLTGLSMLASLKRELGDLDRITGWVKLLGLVNCAPGFSGTPGVINGFSDLITELWGDDGRHARSAIGAAELPFEMSVEVEAILEVSS